ncbi:MAG: hypothetical protein RIF32_05240 [Leptospirales bacterium]|jgi:hypothetical protein
MQVGSAFNASQAMAQVSRSVEQMNQLNQGIVDSSQNLNTKLVGMSAEAKIQNSGKEQIMDLLA